MKENHSHCTLLLDRSGSMSTIKGPTIEGTNKFIKDQKGLKGHTMSFTLIQFDDEYEPNYSFMDVEEVPFLDFATFVPRGMTALLGAIGRAINDTGADLAKLPEDQRPEKVYFVVNTDGLENQSHELEWAMEYTQNKISEMIAHQQEKYGWQFIFLGANQDAILSAKNLSISAASALTYTADATGVNESYGSLSRGLLNARVQKTSFKFGDEDRKKQKVK